MTTGLGVTAWQRARRWGLSGMLAGLWASCLVGCGYQPAYASGSRYLVVAGEVRTALFEATESALAGARSELGAAAAQGGGDYPRVVVDVLRVDERSTGIQNTAGDLPLARGTELVVVGRARVFTGPDTVAFDTGDMSRAASYASATTASADAMTRSRAVRDAARSLGRALGRAVLGLPEPAEG